ncbi:MAG TPA: tryptophan synthase subunit alpha, partial [Eubacteriaceae bacterium]|nr:tryptophan synthase subunit alpha [Eubacteriaceae bacterium]
VKLVTEMEKAGADIVELGIPNADPLADGPVIQRAAQRALTNGVNIDAVFDTVDRIREKTQVPLVFLLYYNTIFRYGISRFIQKAEETGVDGLIIADLPLEERSEFKEALSEKPIDLIPLVAPTSKERIKTIVEDASGFIYCVSSLGVTGVRTSFSQDLESFMQTVAKFTKVPRAIGFGVSGPDAVRTLKNHAEGVIVGSAIIQRIEHGLSDQTHVEKVGRFVNSLKKAIRE